MILGEQPIGMSIKQWRTNMGMTKTEAAKAAGMGLPAWSRIEEGQVPHPQFTTIVRMFQAMGAVVALTAGSGTRSWFGEHVDS